MATKKDFAEYVLDQVEDKKARIKSMFGEYALYYEEKVVAFICDNKVFLKINDATEKILGKNKRGQAYPGSKDYFVISESFLENSHEFKNLIKECASMVSVKKKK
jgi:TfoX/Sxy family transcriptional regulator of competence genes